MKAERGGVGGALLVLLGAAAVAGIAIWILAGEEDPADIILYCGVDQDQSQGLVTGFEEKLGMTVEFHGESEAARSVGLPKRLRAEKENPRAAVYWSNEIMHMSSLVEEGLIAPLPEGVAERFPEEFRDPRGRYIQFGARARVLLVNTELLPDPATHPTSIHDLYDAKYKDMGFRTCMAAPLTGTTLTHAVCLLSHHEDWAQTFYERCARAAEDGILKVVASNGRAMKAVSDSSEKIAFCLTDTDDAHIAIAEKGAPVIVIYPDQGEGQMGTVVLPNTAGLVAGGPSPDKAAKFLELLAQPGTEQQLAHWRSAQIPVRPDIVDIPEHVKRPGVDFRAANFDWYRAAADKDRWLEWLIPLYRPAN